MSAFKTIALPASTWEDIAESLESVGTDDSRRRALLIREQLSGAIKVTATRTTARISAKKGGDIRDSVLLGQPRSK